MGFDSEDIVNVEEGSEYIDSSSEEAFTQIPCKRYVCLEENCSASFNRKWRLECHMRKHTGERPFVCLHDECKKSYTSSSHLKRHVQKVHQPRVDNLLICSYENCEKKFKTQATLNMHIKNMHKKRKYVCKTCSKPFRKHQHLKIHEYEHTGIKPFPCTHPGCEKSFVLPSKLKRHVKIHAGYECDAPHCHTVFRTWTLLRRHLKAYHPLRYTCDTCKRTFNKRYNLQAHLKIHAEQKKTFHCPYDNCPRFYFHERNLRLHIRSYHEERQFHCNIKGCKACFAHKVSLKKHIERHNNNTLPIKKRTQKEPSESKKEKRPKRQQRKSPSLPYLGQEPAAFLSGINENTSKDGLHHHIMSITATDSHHAADHHNVDDKYYHLSLAEKSINTDDSSSYAKTNCNINYPTSNCSQHNPEHSLQDQHLMAVLCNKTNVENVFLPSDRRINADNTSDCAQEYRSLGSPTSSEHNSEHAFQDVLPHLPMCDKQNIENIIGDKIINHSKHTEQDTEK